MKKILSKYKLTVNCSTENLDLIRNYINTVAEKTELTVDKIQQIEMAVDEACTNVIEHACSYDEQKSLTIQIKHKLNELVIEIMDRGKADFNPNDVQKVDLKEFVKQRKTGGLGIHLIKNLMDEVEYFIGTGNQNRVRMVKHI